MTQTGPASSLNPKKFSHLVAANSSEPAEVLTERIGPDMIRDGICKV